MTRQQRPSIFQLGQVIDDGTTLHVHGWGLGLCATACACHRHPLTGQLAVVQDQEAGTLGLATYTGPAMGRPLCGCCTPWTATELAAILRDLADVAALATT
jgi:hypothetical protein